MVYLNKVFLIGNLVNEPTLRATPSGTPVGDFRIAINRKYRDSLGELQTETVYITVVVWGKTAENCRKFLSTGRTVLVEGRLTQDSWEDPEGKKRSVIKISAERVTFFPQTSRDVDITDKRDFAEEAKPEISSDLDEDLPF